MQCPNHPRSGGCNTIQCRECDREAASTDQAAGKALVLAELHSKRPAKNPAKSEDPTRQAALERARAERHAYLIGLIDRGDRR